MKRMIGLGLVAVLLLAAVPAFSQVGLYIGGFGGVSQQKPSFDAAQFNTDTTFVYGLRGGVRILMLALEVSYFRAGHNISMGDFVTFQWNGLQNDFSYVGASLRWIFSLAILHPYLTAGYGYYTADIKSIDKARDGGYNFGAGLEIAFGSKISLVAEGKYHHVIVDISKISLGLGDFIMTAGLNFNF
jgi:opacity protein-like surface antigen